MRALPATVRAGSLCELPRLKRGKRPQAAKNQPCGLFFSPREIPVGSQLPYEESNSVLVWIGTDVIG